MKTRVRRVQFWALTFLSERFRIRWPYELGNSPFSLAGRHLAKDVLHCNGNSSTPTDLSCGRRIIKYFHLCAKPSTMHVCTLYTCTPAIQMQMQMHFQHFHGQPEAGGANALKIGALPLRETHFPNSRTSRTLKETSKSEKVRVSV